MAVSVIYTVGHELNTLYIKQKQLPVGVLQKSCLINFAKFLKIEF